MDTVTTTCTCGQPSPAGPHSLDCPAHPRNDARAGQERVNYDARTGDVILLHHFNRDGSPRAFIVKDVYPHGVKMCGVGVDSMFLGYADLDAQGATYAWQRPTVAGPRPAPFTGGLL